MTLKKHIPNFLTLLNLFFGCLSILGIIVGDLYEAAIFIFVAAFFDLLDGLAARALKATSSIGKELDSLADVVSFGVAPGMIIWKLLDVNLPAAYASLSILAFLIPLASALRLAKFNLDTRQSENFIGLPVPANAVLIASFPMIFDQESPDFSWLSEFIMNPWFLLAYTGIFSVLLVSEIPLIGLKFKGYRLKGNEIKYLFLLCSIVLIILLKFTAIPYIIILYFILSYMNKLLKK